MKKFKSFVSIFTMLAVVLSTIAFIPIDAFADSDFDAYLNSQGFYGSYKVYLKELHQKYPQWNFVAVDTGLDWNSAVLGEKGTSCSKQLISKSLLSSHPEWFCRDSNCVDSQGNLIVKEGSTWYSASYDGIAHYLDPRNFLNETDIFQFEDLKYSDGHTIDGINAILKGTFMYQSNVSYLDSNGNTINTSDTYASLIMEAAKASGVGAYYIASKIKQEIGATPSLAVTGNVEGYKGIYNFYNIGANTGVYDGLKWASATSSVNTESVSLRLRSEPNTTSAVITTMPKGSAVTVLGTASGTSVNSSTLWYKVQYGSYIGYAHSSYISKATYGRPWNTPRTSIINGAVYVGEKFINKGQNTGYYQKFNVNPDSAYTVHTHEYMANVSAATSESRSTYKAYNSLGLLNQTKTFYIPLYKNMPNQEPIYSLNVYGTVGSIIKGDTQFGGESISGLSVTLYDNNGTYLTETMTDNNGYFEFNSVNSGKYYIIIGSLSALPRKINFTLTDNDLTLSTSLNKIGIIMADFNCDGFINTSDYTVFSNALGLTSNDEAYSSSYDFNKDGYISSSDYIIFSSFLGLSTSYYDNTFDK